MAHRQEEVMSGEEKLHRVGALWKGKEGSKARASGTMTVAGMKQSFAVFVNEKKRPGSNQPDYVLLSREEPETDEYVQRVSETTTEEGASL